MRDFNIFGEDSKNPDKSRVLPPIPTKKSYKTMSDAEIEDTIDKIKRLSNRAVACLITGKNI